MEETEIIYYPETGSTNAVAKETVRAKDKDARFLQKPFCIVADKQTAGAGRHGRRFWSPLGGIYMTMVVPETYFKEQIITGRIGKCVVNVINGYVKGAKIKGINDVMLDGKKVAGILVEKVTADRFKAQFFIIGIGINLRQTEPVPQNLKDIVGFLNIDTDKNIIINEIINEILKTDKPNL